MASPGRPKSILDTADVLSDSGELVKPPTRDEKTKEEEPSEYIFELVGDYPKDPENGTIRYPLSFQLGNSKPLFDPEKGVVRMARLLRGIPTIWQDEQKDVPEKYAERNKINPIFNQGRLVVPSSEKGLIKFLLLRSDNQDCQTPAENVMPKYRQVNTAVQEQLGYKQLKQMRDAAKLAWDTEYDEMVSHAKYLGIVLVNSEGKLMSEEGIRTAYVKRAEAAPEKFLQTYRNPKIKTFGLAKMALEKDHIIYVDGQFSWNTDNKPVFLQVPQSYKDKPADYLAEYMLLKDGVEVLNRLEAISK